jgi:hypothetical protein
MPSSGVPGLSGKAAYPVLLKPPEKLGHSLKRPPRQLSVIMLNNKKAWRSPERQCG